MNDEQKDIQVHFRADASAQRVARVYAEALLDEAEKRGQAEEVLHELEDLARDVAGADPLLASFFGGGVVGRDRRAAALRAALAGRANPLVLNLLLVLNDHERTALLPAAAVIYRDLLERHTGKVHVHVRSAVPLEDYQRQRLLGELRDLLQRDPILEEKVDPDLLGGLVVRVGDFLYDASVRSQIETIRDQLIERSSHAIEIGRDRFSSA